MVHISLTNSKLGACIPSVSLPPHRSCRPDAPCLHSGCYGKKGNFQRFENVKQAHIENFERYESDPKGYFADIVKFLTGGLVSYRYFRWHTVGDIVDDEYFQGIIDTARKCPDVKFLCFTKKFDIVNRYEGDIPENLKIVFSAWSKGFKVDNPKNFPIAYVFFKKPEKNPNIPEMAIPCGGHCPDCLACWSLRKGQSVFFNEH